MCCPWRASSAQDKFCTAVLKGTPASLHLWVMSHALKSCKQIVNSHTRENLQQAFKIKWKKQQCCQIPISSYLLQAAWLLLKRVSPREAALLAHFRTRVDSDDLPVYTEQNNLLGIAYWSSKIIESNRPTTSGLTKNERILIRTFFKCHLNTDRHRTSTTS